MLFVTFVQAHMTIQSVEFQVPTALTSFFQYSKHAGSFQCCFVSTLNFLL